MSINFNRRRFLAAVAATTASAQAWPLDVGVRSTRRRPSIRPTPWLPFDMPTRQTLASSPKKVWAHWMGGAFPISVDNKDAAVDPSEYWRNNWMPPGNIEGGSNHAAYGGFVRQRKPYRAPLPAAATSYEVRDKVTEIGWIVGAGIDGFTAELLSVPVNGVERDNRWLQVNQLFAAADQVADPTFTITLMPDSHTLQNDPAAVAAALHSLSSRRVTRIDGRLVIAPYAPEAKGLAFWTEVLNLLRSRYGHNPIFWGCYSAAWRSSGQAPTFDSIAYGHSRWGERDPLASASNTIDTGQAPRYCHSTYNKPWMHYVAPGDERPHAGIFSERRNSDQLVSSWLAAINAGADCNWVQIATWDDFAEGSAICPTQSSKHFWLDINAYFLTRYKTGSWPTIVRDAVYLSHRRQPLAGVTYTGQQTKFQSLTGATPAVDRVEALVFSSKPSGTVTITIGGQDTSFDIATLVPVAPGVYSCTAALRSGSCSAVFRRAGVTVAAVTSPTPVSRTQIVQDTSYYGCSSLR